MGPTVVVKRRCDISDVRQTCVTRRASISSAAAHFKADDDVGDSITARGAELFKMDE